MDDITQFFENLATLEQQCDTQFTETTGAELYQLLRGQKLQLDDMGDVTLLYACLLYTSFIRYIDRLMISASP